MIGAQDATEIMKKSHMTYYYAGNDGVAEVSMKIVDSKGKERNRKFTMIRLDEADGGDQKYYTYFYEPSDVQRLTFMVHKSAAGNDKRWIYVPAVDLIKPIAADDKNSSFVGSDFTYEDVSGRLWTEDNHTFVGESKLNDRDVFVIESKPKQAYKGFSRRVSYIDKEYYLPLKEEYYDAKDKLERVLTADKIETIDNIPTVTIRKMENVQKGRHTVVTFSSIKYNMGIKSDLFTERYLRTPPREYIK
jgi:outer membrane lipoprotein-sorting protein